MRANERTKKFLSILLTLCMMLTYVPTTAFAATADNLCEHHTAHSTEVCGYVTSVDLAECTYYCDICMSDDHVEEAVACNCGTDDAAVHAVSCAVYVQPENPECLCTEKCEESNIWCDICGFDYTQCGGSQDKANDAYSDSSYEACIGEDEYFSSLQEAVDAAEDTDTVKLLTGIELTDSVLNVSGDKKITIDFNGFTITGTVTSTTTQLVFVSGGCELTLLDSSDSMTGGIQTINTGGKLSNLIRVSTDGKLTIKNGNYYQDASNNGSGMIDSRGDNIITVEGGNFHLENIGTAQNGSPWLFNGSGQQENTIIVTGGTFNADVLHQYWVFEVAAPKERALKDNGDGTWTMVDAVAYVNEQEWSSAWYRNEVGYTTLEEALEAAEPAQTKTSGGKTYTSEIEVVTLLQDVNVTGAVAVKDGTDLDCKGHKIVLAAKEATLTAPEGLDVITTVAGYEVSYKNGVYSVRTHVASIGNDKYFSLQDAVDAAKDNDIVKLLTTITLTDDDMVKIDGKYNVMVNVTGKSITLNMNGKTIDVDYNGGQYLYAVIYTADGATLTVTGNGTIDVSENGINVAYMFWKRGTTGALTIENGTYHMDDSGDSIIYTNGNRIVTVNDGTFTLDAVGTRANGFPVIFNAHDQNTKKIIVNGGTYNFDINHQYWVFEVEVPKERALKSNGDGTWTMVDAVAYVNEKEGSYTHEVGYATLDEAISAADVNETITLLQEMNVTGAVAVKDGTDLDCNGYKIVLAAKEATLTAPEGLDVITTVAGYEVSYEDGVYKAVKEKVAQNTTTAKLYAYVSEALSAAESGETVILLKDTSENLVFTTNGTALDLNGKTMTSTNETDYILTINGGDMTITDSAGNGTISGHYGVRATNSTVTIDGGIISGVDCDFALSNSAITLTLAESEDEGASFPGGITIEGTTLNTILGTDVAFWQGDQMIVLEEDQTAITGGTVTVKAECKHIGEKTYTANEDRTTHKVMCNLCSVAIAEAHTPVYSASGDTIAVSCSADCGYTGTATVIASDKTYDGAPVDATVTTNGDLLGTILDIAYAVKNGEALNEVPVNAGTYTASITMGEGDAAKTASVEFTIAKAPLAVTANATSITYGDAPAANGVTGRGLIVGESLADLSGELTYNFSYEQYGSVGTYKITPAGLTSDNYEIIFVAGDLTVNAKAITVTAEAKSKTYGESDPALTYTVNGLVNGDQLTGNLTRAPGENVGTYSIAQGTLAASENYTITYTGANLTVNAKAITEADVKLNGSLTYTGSEQTQPITVTNGVTYTVSGDKAINAGTYELTVTGTGNYTGEVKLSWSIDEAAAVIGTAPEKNNLIYNGEAQDLVTAGTTADGTIAYSLRKDGDYSATIPTGKDAGNYTVWYYVVGDENHADSEPASISVTIKKAPADYEDPIANTLTYNGSAQALVAEGITADGTMMYKLGEDGTYSATVPSAEDADTYTVYYYVKGDHNHDDSAEQQIDVTIGQLDITGKSVDITLADSLTYNGTEQTMGVSSVKLGDLVVTYTVSGNIGTDATEYTLTITGSGNFKGTATKDWSIAKKSVNVTTEDQSITYGETISGTEITATGLVDGHSATATLTPSTANVTVSGVITASAAIITVDGTDVTANYNVSYTPGKLMIEPDTSKIDDLTTENVTSANEEDIKAVQAMMGSAEKDGIDDTTAAQWAAITANCEALIDAIKAAQDATDTGNTEKVEDVTAENVKPEDKEALEDAKADLEKALEDNSSNYTEEEKEAIQDEIQRIEDAIGALENVEDMTDVITQLPESVEPDDKEAAEKILDAKEAYDELTENEKSLIDEDTKKKLDDLVTALTAYDIIKGGNSKWAKGSSHGLTFTANGPFNKFVGVEVDGKEVDVKHYEAKAGSTIVTLKQSFLRRLSTGEHTITVLYTDGETSGTFKVLAAHSTSLAVVSSPSTGDNSNTMLWSGMLCVSTLGLISIIVNHKRRRSTK